MNKRFFSNIIGLTIGILICLIIITGCLYNIVFPEKVKNDMEILYVQLQDVNNNSEIYFDKYKAEHGRALFTGYIIAEKQNSSKVEFNYLKENLEKDGWRVVDKRAGYVKLRNTPYYIELYIDGNKLSEIITFDDLFSKYSL